MLSRTVFYFWVAVLFIIGIALMFYRHIVFDVPWVPTEHREIWQIEAKIQFKANSEDKPVSLSFSVPRTQDGFTLLGQTPASPGYGVNFYDAKTQSKAVYTINSASGSQTLFYTITALADPNAKAEATPAPDLSPIETGEVESAAENEILRSASAKSADTQSLATEIYKLLISGDQNASLLLKDKKIAPLMRELLMKSGIPTRIVRGLELQDNRRKQKLVEYLQIFDKDNILIMNPASGEFGKPENLLLWEYNDLPIIDLEGGSKAKLSFAMMKKEIPLAIARSEKFKDTEYINFSLDMLPIDDQALFRNILLLPIGVLVVVFLRIVVGLKTSGTFMPVLLAMAFMQTSLPVGVTGLLLIVSIGLLIRFYLSKLNLLLVARISTVIVTVIGIITFLTVLTHSFGITDGMKILFFPLIIISWTIERMSILWEEEGAKQVVIQGGGSLLTAILAYLAMSVPLIQHLTFNFLGLQLVIVGILLVLGNYTGYRLTELKRFKPLADEIGD